MIKKEIETYSPKSQTEWRQWLEKNHQSKLSVWLIYYTKKSSIPSLSWSEAVDEALALVGLTAQERRLTNFRLCSFLASVNPKAIGQKSIKKKFNNSLTAKE